MKPTLTEAQARRFQRATDRLSQAYGDLHTLAEKLGIVERFGDGARVDILSVRNGVFHLRILASYIVDNVDGKVS